MAAHYLKDHFFKIFKISFIFDFCSLKFNIIEIFVIAKPMAKIVNAGSIGRLFLIMQWIKPNITNPNELKILIHETNRGNNFNVILPEKIIFVFGIIRQLII